MYSFARSMLAVLLLALNVASQEPTSIALSAETLEFPAQSVGTCSSPLTLTLSNTGTATIALHTILVSGIDFSQTNNCSDKLAAGTNCSIAIAFKPAVTGTRLGALHLSWSGTGSPRTIPLSGIGQ